MVFYARVFIPFRTRYTIWTAKKLVKLVAPSADSDGKEKDRESLESEYCECPSYRNGKTIDTLLL